MRECWREVTISYSQSSWGISVSQATHGTIPEVTETILKVKSLKRERIYICQQGGYGYVSVTAWDSVFGG